MKQTVWGKHPETGLTISIDGQVMGRNLSPNGHGRLRVKSHGLPYHVSHLVLETFVERKTPSNPLCLHRNDIPLDNRVENLYWGDHYDNTRDAYRNGARTQTAVTEAKYKPVLIINGDGKRTFESQNDVAEYLGCSVALVSKRKNKNKPIKGWILKEID